MAARPRQSLPVFADSNPAPQDRARFAREEAEQSKRQDAVKRYSFEAGYHRSEVLSADERWNYETAAFRFFTYVVEFDVVPIEQRQQNATLIASDPRSASWFGWIQGLSSTAPANLRRRRNRTSPQLVAIHSSQVAV
ncbi:MAG TPA: hypothetical protein VEV41_16050 [Terriglobales bacterium]|nr:hypothetical protein [Terriglobales bacterium]